MSLLWRHFLILAALGAIRGTMAMKATECKLWDEASTNTMAQEFLDVTCARNSLCTGLTCSGKLLYNAHVFLGAEPFGFAVEFIPCSYPLVLRLLVNSTDLHFTKLIGVQGHNEEAILLVIPGSGGSDENYGRVNLAWNSFLKPVKYFVALQVNFTRLYTSGEFPAIPLVPLRSYPVPNCQYGPSKGGTTTTARTWKEINCRGNECIDEDGNIIVYEPDRKPDYSFILKVCAGVGAIFFALGALGAVIIARRRHRSASPHKVEAEKELKPESDEDESLEFSQDSGEDKRNLIRV